MAAGTNITFKAIKILNTGDINTVSTKFILLEMKYNVINVARYGSKIAITVMIKGKPIVIRNNNPILNRIRRIKGVFSPPK